MYSSVDVTEVQYVRLRQMALIGGSLPEGRMQSKAAIAKAREAAHCLLVHWPDCRGDAYHRAVRMCGLVLCGLVAPEVACIAFLEAAEEPAIYGL